MSGQLLRIEPDGEGGERHVYICEACEGTGLAPDDDDCPLCDGLGEWFE